MADCTDLFLNYHQSISLTKTDRKFLRAARKAITQKIRKYFKENADCSKVDFKGQGSFTMDTIIKPLVGEYDIDIGVYLRGYGNWQSNWPTPETASGWLIAALKNHTSFKPINKTKCVRIKYQPTSANKEVAYHVDLPVYCEYYNFLNEKFTRIGVIGSTRWSEKSDPVGFSQWFFEKCAENQKDKNQLIRLVMYMKAWKDHIKENSRFPSGMALAILMANNYAPHKREDVAFKETIRLAYNSLYTGLNYQIFGINSVKINSPVIPMNDILENLDIDEKRNFRNLFENLVDAAILAVKNSSKAKSISIWQNYFDERMV